MFCPRCGAENAPDTTFCRSCGHSLSEDREFVNSHEHHLEEASEKAPGKSSLKSVLPRPPLVAVVLAALAAVVVAGAVIWTTRVGAAESASAKAGSEKGTAHVVSEKERDTPKERDGATRRSSNSAGSTTKRDEAESVEDTISFAEVESQVTSYTVDYLWQAKGYSSATDGSIFSVFRTLAGEGIPNGAVLGALEGDYDTDGVSELLVVTWRDGLPRIEVRETDGTVADMAIEDDYTNFPLGNEGALDVFVDENDRIFVQSWSGPLGIADGYGWELYRVTLANGVLSKGGSAIVGGSAIDSLLDVRQQIESLGLPVSNVPDYDGSRDGFSNVGNEFVCSLYADREATVQVVARMTATCEDFYDGTSLGESYEIASSVLSSDANEWCDSYPMGTLTIGPRDDADSFADTAQVEEPAKPKRYEAGDAIVVTGTLEYEEYDYKGGSVTCAMLVLDEPVDLFLTAYADYSNNNGEPTLHAGVVSADVTELIEPGTLENHQRVRVSGSVGSPGKWVGTIDSEGNFTPGGGALMIVDGSYERL